MGSPVRFRNVHYYRVAGKYIFADLALLVLAVIYLAQRFGGSYASRVDFWNDTLSDEEFQARAMKYIDRFKTERAAAAFSQTLPVPTRVVVSEISNMRLSRSGTLSFSAQSDTHDFNIGLLKKKLLRNAMWEAGLGQV